MCADTDVPVPLQRHNATACMEGDVRNEIQATENAEQARDSNTLGTELC